MRGLLCLLLLSFAAAAQEYDAPAPDETSMAHLAAQLLESGPAIEPESLARLQMVAGQYDKALQTLAGAPSVSNVRWEIYAAARLKGGAFDEAFKSAFRERMRRTDDKNAVAILWTFGTRLDVLEASLRDALAKNRGKVTRDVATDLVKRWLGVTAYRAFAPIIQSLTDEDDARRYVIAKDIAVKTPDGATICALVVRPRTDAKLPALFNLTIYADADNNFSQARRNAANGFAAVLGLTRGKGCSPDKTVPYEHDSADAAAVIDWIAKQPWNNGKVGMYGGSYEGFTAWAATKKMPKALKAIMAGAPVAPAIDVPMEGNVFWNFVYPWPLYTTNVKYLDNATYFDNDRWNRLYRTWYTSGRAYRDLPIIDGTPNPIFDTWIAHPNYDAYWQNMIPYKKEFARIGIAVLQTAGYYFGGPGAATYYMTEHYKYRPNAEHYLVIGPYDHVRGHSGTVNIVGTKTTNINGYEIDPAAQLDVYALRYQWFDYTLKGGPKPALLQDKVNYEVVGANTWKHAPSLAAMASRQLRFDLKQSTLTVNMADRSDVDAVIPGGIVDKDVDVSNGVKFVGEPLAQPTELSGLFKGDLQVVANKRDFDFIITVYELTADGHYFLLAPYWTRASYAGHLSERTLLEPGKPRHMAFESVRLMSKRLERGSRIVAVFQVLKSQGQQINYGTGKDVSAETIADAGEPLKVEIRGFLELPVGR